MSTALAPSDALRAILERVRPLEPERAPLAQACGRVLAEPVIARAPLPAFDSSAVDGYAVRSQDAAGASSGTPVRLRVVDAVFAGSPSKRPLGFGEAMRVLTGARVPAGADAVVMQERVFFEGSVLTLTHPASPGDHIREKGEDAGPGDLLLEAGAALRPYEIALLAAQGQDAALVTRRPRVEVLSTGDEVVEAGLDPADGEIYDANGPAAVAALSRWGAVARAGGVVRDQPGALEAAFLRALDAADALVVSGGVSVGDRDWTSAALRALGAEVVFAGAAIKPGKPLLFAVRAGKPVFGLPGNPVAALVCLEEFVRPAVEALLGLTARPPSYHLRGRLSAHYVKKPGRVQYLFCRAQRSGEGFLLEPVRPQGSHRLAAAVKANALALAPAEAGPLAAGTELAFRWLK